MWFQFVKKAGITVLFPGKFLFAMKRIQFVLVLQIVTYFCVIIRGALNTFT